MPSVGQNSTPVNQFSRTVYNTLFKRNSVFLAGVFVSAFAFEIVFDRSIDRIWDNLNRGKQWKDVKARFVEE